MTRGERNQNPCNIRISTTPWQGKIAPNTDGEFEQFDTYINGIRAGGRIFISYYRLRGLSTIPQLISRWAPPSDNNPTDAYISAVCTRMAVPAYKSINVLDASILADLLGAVITQENGENIYPAPDILTAAQEALA